MLRRTPGHGPVAAGLGDLGLPVQSRHDVQPTAGVRDPVRPGGQQLLRRHRLELRVVSASPHGNGPWSFWCRERRRGGHEAADRARAGHSDRSAGGRLPWRRHAWRLAVHPGAVCRRSWCSWPWRSCLFLPEPRPSARPEAGLCSRLARAASPHACLAFQSVLRRRVRGLRRPVGLAAEVLHRCVRGVAVHRRVAGGYVHPAGQPASPAGRLSVGPLRASQCDLRGVHRHDGRPVPPVAAQRYVRGGSAALAPTMRRSRSATGWGCGRSPV